MSEFELQNICRRKTLDDGEEITILDHLNTSFEMGRMSAVIGPSGGGKSTLLRLLNRLDEPDTGQIVRRGHPLRSYPVRQLRRKVAFVSQQMTVFAGSLKKNLLLPQAFCLPRTPEYTSRTLNDLLEKVGLSSRLLERPAAELSGGEKQRLALVRAILTAPEVLILDEPGSNLDPPARELLSSLLRQQVDAGLTVILSSHDISFVRRTADDFLFLSQGQIKVHGEVEGLEQPLDPELRRFIESGGNHD
jgi:putative ABC transport system ATP-binding protein